MAISKTEATIMIIVFLSINFFIYIYNRYLIIQNKYYYKKQGIVDNFMV